jgi:hypothetical protein
VLAREAGDVELPKVGESHSCGHPTQARRGSQDFPRSFKRRSDLAIPWKLHWLQKSNFHNFRWREIALLPQEKSVGTSWNLLAMLHTWCARIATREIRCVVVCYLKRKTANHNVGVMVTISRVSRCLNRSIGGNPQQLPLQETRQRRQKSSNGTRHLCLRERSQLQGDSSADSRSRILQAPRSQTVSRSM